MIRVQIFTDGGVFKKHNLGVSVGIICMNGEEKLKFDKYNHNVGSDFCEIFAINKALKRVYGQLSQHNMYGGDYSIEVYTDSKVSINSIQSGRLCKNIEERVHRDKLLEEIREVLQKFDHDVIFYHIRSHISSKMLKEAYYQYCDENHVTITFDEFLFIYQKNLKCDKYVKKSFKKYNKKEIIALNQN